MANSNGQKEKDSGSVREGRVQGVTEEGEIKWRFQRVGKKY